MAEAEAMCFLLEYCVVCTMPPESCALRVCEGGRCAGVCECGRECDCVRDAGVCVCDGEGV